MGSATVIVVAAFIAVFPALWGQTDVAAQNAPPEWTQEQTPFRIFGQTYYVGTRGVSSILITSDQGHVLIDGAMPQSAPMIADHIRALGFRVEDVELIVNSHIHYDHAGGISGLQRLTGARVAASPSSAAVLRSGRSGPDDPQYGLLPPIDPVRDVRVIADGETLRIGSLSVQGHFTGGHTPGGTSWTWRSCEGVDCRNIVYADSMTAVSADTFKFSSSTTYPKAVADFEKSIAFLRKTPCDLLLTPHPDASGWTPADAANPHPSPKTCAAYADEMEAKFDAEFAKQRAAK